MTPDQAVTSALEALAASFDEIGVPAMVIGGIAVVARGVPRTTLDVDATVWAEQLDLERALRVFERHGLVPRVPNADRFAATHHVILLRHERSGTPLDVSLARLAFEQEALARATVVDFGGPALRVARAEDLVIYKAVAWRERDRSDIERLLVIHSSEVDLQRVRAVVAEFAAALETPERVTEFEALLARVLGPPAP